MLEAKSLIVVSGRMTRAYERAWACILDIRAVIQHKNITITKCTTIVHSYMFQFNSGFFNQNIFSVKGELKVQLTFIHVKLTNVVQNQLQNYICSFQHSNTKNKTKNIMFYFCLI